MEVVKWGGENLVYTASRDRTIKVWAVSGTDRVRERTYVYVYVDLRVRSSRQSSLSISRLRSRVE